MDGTVEVKYCPRRDDRGYADKRTTQESAHQAA